MMFPNFGCEKRLWSDTRTRRDRGTRPGAKRVTARCHSDRIRAAIAERSPLFAVGRALALWAG